MAGEIATEIDYNFCPMKIAKYLSALGLPSLYLDLKFFLLISNQQSESTDFILKYNKVVFYL